jgi:hypothetical protein
MQHGRVGDGTGNDGNQNANKPSRVRSGHRFYK